MEREFYPQGAQAALLPKAAYSVPGLFLYTDLIARCLEQSQAKFHYRLPIAYLYGSPRVRWNCGRLLLVDHHRTGEDFQAELTRVTQLGITPLLTFSSPLLCPEDLNDPACNELLDILEELHGGVILASPLLTDYIRRRCPHIELHASVLLPSMEPHRDLAYYQALADGYDRYVLHPDDNFRPDLLEQVPKEKAEILVNERCVPHCPQRREHYESIARDQIALLDGTGPLSNFLDRCPFVPDFKQADTDRRNISLTTREVAALSQMGFPLFKLQGRLDSPYLLFFELFRYTLEDQAAFPAMYAAFSYSIQAYLKQKKKKREEAAQAEGKK